MLTNIKSKDCEENLKKLEDVRRKGTLPKKFKSNNLERQTMPLMLKRKKYVASQSPCLQ